MKKSDEMRYESSPSQDVRTGDRPRRTKTSRNACIIYFLNRCDFFRHMVKDYSFRSDDNDGYLYQYGCFENGEIFEKVVYRVRE